LDSSSPPPPIIAWSIWLGSVAESARTVKPEGSTNCAGDILARFVRFAARPSHREFALEHELDSNDCVLVLLEDGAAFVGKVIGLAQGAEKEERSEKASRESRESSWWRF